MTQWLVVVLLGLIEGLTEFLPVSSTGHLLLAEHWLPHQSDLFNTVIQSGAVLAVVGVFYRKIWHLARTCREADSQAYIGKLLLAFGITAAGGLALKAAHVGLPDHPRPVAIATLVGGVLFIAVERWLMGRSQASSIGWGTAAAIGASQLLAAVFPGASRSGTTILVALALGTARPIATEFSFLLGIPTLLAASAVEVADAVRHPGGPPEAWGPVLLASAVAAVTAFAVVHWLLRFVQTHSFVVFGWYRIVLGLLLLGWLL